MNPAITRFILPLIAACTLQTAARAELTTASDTVLDGTFRAATFSMW